MDLVTFNKEILNGKLHFLFSDICHNSFSPMLKCKAGLHANESCVKNKLSAIVLIKANF